MLYKYWTPLEMQFSIVCTIYTQDKTPPELYTQDKTPPDIIPYLPFIFSYPFTKQYYRLSNASSWYNQYIAERNITTCKICCKENPTTPWQIWIMTWVYIPKTQPYYWNLCLCNSIFNRTLKQRRISWKSWTPRMPGMVFVFSTACEK